MNKKSNRNHLRAPTTKPAGSIAPSPTLALDGDVPLSASNGVDAPEPVAAHDVLQAALAPLPGDATAADAAPEAPVDADTTAVPAAAPVKPAKVPKIKFVECTFALPESEAELLDAMKKTHQANGLSLKKGQLLRAGLLALADVDAERLAQLLAHLPAEPRASKKKK